MPRRSERLAELAAAEGKTPLRFLVDAVNLSGSTTMAARVYGVPWRTFYGWLQRYRLCLVTRALAPGEPGYRDPVLEEERVA